MHHWNPIFKMLRIYSQKSSNDNKSYCSSLLHDSNGWYSIFIVFAVRTIIALKEEKIAYSCWAKKKVIKT